MPLATQSRAHLGRTTLEEILKSTGGTISIIALVESLIAHAHDTRASDIHIDPLPDHLAVRLRIDGVLQDACTFPKKIHQEVVSRIKVLSGLRTDEHQAAQDGRFRVVLGDVPIDVRVSIVPTYHGENAVLRLLTDQAQDHTLEHLGFSASDQAKVLEAIRRPHGMILATGPTGSGKTTTLYTLIKKLHTSEISIVTIEDPIEYALPGITQIQINPRTGLTFASGLRSVLRQDPNIIMVGEIRDAETAGIAVNTALTGHLLLSTLHTNDAATTLPRLLDMGIDPYLVASTVVVAVGQRLVRRICPHCKAAVSTDEQAQANARFASYIDKNATLYKGAGCTQCDQTGFNGRVGINEVLLVDDEVRAAIVNKASAKVIRDIAIKNGMTTMFEDGITKALAGETTLSEVLRTIYE
jgi:type IV pilus assembly protein PilB